MLVGAGAGLVNVKDTFILFISWETASGYSEVENVRSIGSTARVNLFGLGKFLG